MMKFIRALLVSVGVLAACASCGDDTTKALTTAAGVGGGAVLGNYLAKGKNNKTLGMLVGGAAGGGLGYLLGSSISGGGEKK